MMNFLLILILPFLYWKNKGRLAFSHLFLALIISFHFIPLIFFYINYDAIILTYSLIEISEGIEKTGVVCLFISLGILLFSYISKYQKWYYTENKKKPTNASWIWINYVTGFIIVFNNYVTAYHAINSGYLDIYTSTLPLLSLKTVTVLPLYVFTLFYLILSWVNFRNTFSKQTFHVLLAIFILFVTSFIFTGSRSTVIYIILSIFVLWSSRFNFRISKYIPHIIALIFVSTIIGVLREGEYAGLDLSSLFLRPIVELSNTSIVLVNSNLIADEFSVSVSRYFAAFLYILPVSFLHVFEIAPPTLLSQQYVNIIDPGWADMGGGFGFSLVAEIYLLGSQKGAWAFALLIGFFLGWIDQSLKSSNIKKSALAASVGFFMLFIARGEIIELYRNIAVVFLIYIFSRMRLK